MSFLTPLYITGILAVALPILFHLIRRTPQQKQVFSSLMFLAPSPPRLTRKSRLSNILLLILRASALILLALAFARPFLQQSIAGEQSNRPGRRIALLVDTSASMRRGNLWSNAQAEVDLALKEVTDQDEVALFLFDKDVRTAFTLDQWNRIEPSQRSAAIRSVIANVAPSWAETQIGHALSSVAEQIAATENKDGSADSISRKIILISDLQQGSHAEALQGHQWPDKVVLEIKPVSSDQVTNASLQLIESQPDAPDAADTRPRIRVSNSPESTIEQFTLTWANDNGAIPTTQPQKVYVPPGRGQVVRVDWPAEDQHANRLILQGDSSDFDNSYYLVRPRQEKVRIVYLGNDRSDDPKGLAFYLKSAFSETAMRKVEFAEQQTTPISSPELTDANLIVITKLLPADQIATIKKLIEAGNEALWVLDHPGDISGLENMLGVSPISIQESSVRNFSLVSRVDLQHPLFSVFADSRFSDFSQIHFWKHRTLDLPESAGFKTIAWFDNGDPYLIEKQIGKGRLIIATSGWQPADSQLALSTKFVPLLSGMVQLRHTGLSKTQYAVGDSIPTPDADQRKWMIKTPDRREIELSKTTGRLTATDQPGIYTIFSDQEQFALAVNLSADESRTAALDPADFKQWGAKFDPGPETQAVAEHQRQLKYFELENRQKIWQWLILGMLGLVAAETLLAGRLARRPTRGASDSTVSNEVTV